MLTQVSSMLVGPLKMGGTLADTADAQRTRLPVTCQLAPPTAATPRARRLSHLVFLAMSTKHALPLGLGTIMGQGCEKQCSCNQNAFHEHAPTHRVNLMQGRRAPTKMHCFSVFRWATAAEVSSLSLLRLTGTLHSLLGQELQAFRCQFQTLPGSLPIE
jgi:hypothetical protein